MTSNTADARAQVAQRRQQQAEARTGPTLRQQIEKMEPQFARAMPRGMEASQLVRDALTALGQVRKLAECEPSTVLGALMSCAALGLRPGPLQQVYLVPFFNSKARQFEATVIIGYRGYVALARRSGEIESLIARTVYVGDEFRIAYGIEDSLVHVPTLDGSDDRLAVAWYAVAKYKGGGHSFVVIGPREVAKAKAASQSGRKDQGPWASDPNAMSEKTAVRRLAKWLPLTVDLAAAMAVDDTVRTDLDADALSITPPSFADIDTIEGEVVDTTTGEVQAPENAQEPPDNPPRPADTNQVEEEPDAKPPAAPSNKQVTALHAALGEAGITDRDQRLTYCGGVVGREIGSTSELTRDETSTVIDNLTTNR